MKERESVPIGQQPATLHSSTDTHGAELVRNRLTVLLGEWPNSIGIVY